MPKLKLTYQKDIDREGSDTIDVDEGRAQVLISQRRAVLVPEKPKKRAARKQ